MRKEVLTLSLSEKHSLSELELELTVKLVVKSTFKDSTDAIKSIKKAMNFESFNHAFNMISPKISEYKRIPLTQVPLGE